MFPIRDTKKTKKIPVVTMVIIAANIWVFLNELLSPNLPLLIQSYALIPQSVDFGNYQTLIPFITSQFLHAGFVHLGSNMWFLWIFGANLEAALGKIKFLIFYLTSGVIAGLAQYSFLADTTMPMLGASGAIAGVLGGYLKLFPKHRIETLVPIFGLPLIMALPASMMLFYWFFTQLFNGVAALYINTAAIGGVAWWAHIGGFITGWTLINIFGPARKR